MGFSRSGEGINRLRSVKDERAAHTKALEKNKGTAPTKSTNRSNSSTKKR